MSARDVLEYSHRVGLVCSVTERLHVAGHFYFTTNYPIVNCHKEKACIIITLVTGAVAESADAVDLKSTGGNTLRVQVPLAPLIMSLQTFGKQ